MLLEGVDATDTPPLSRIQRGMGFVPEDRLGMGLATGLTVADNLALKTYRQSPSLADLCYRVERCKGTLRSSSRSSTSEEPD